MFWCRGKILILLHSYLEDRKQFCKIGNCCLSLENVTSGVPQGYILGPLLFLIFTNGLPDANPNIEGFGFADDYKFIAHDQAKLETKIIENWCRKNGMELNTNKCKLLNVRANQLYVWPGNKTNWIPKRTWLNNYIKSLMARQLQPQSAKSD